MTDPASDNEKQLAWFAEQYDVDIDAVRHLFAAISDGGGDMAMFDHPGLYGPGQWMRGGLLMTTIPDDRVFNNRIAALCQALAEWMRRRNTESAVKPHRIDSRARAWDTTPSSYQRWWPDAWGEPTINGYHGDIAYAFFERANRFAIQQQDQQRLYDTQGLRITGIAGTVSGTIDDLILTTLREKKSIDKFKRLADSEDSRDPAEKIETDTHEKIIAAIEKLAELRDSAILTEDEFQSKKRDLLARL